MKRFFLIALSALCASPLYASTTQVNCQIAYNSADGAATINTIQNISLSPFTYSKMPFGNLTLEVGISEPAMTSTGEQPPAVSVEIYDNNYIAPQAGEISANPNNPAKASYEVKGSKEALAVLCGVVR